MLDFLHDFCLGQDVQDFWDRIHSIPSSGDALCDEGRVNQARSGSHRWFVICLNLLCVERLVVLILLTSERIVYDLFSLVLSFL